MFRSLTFLCFVLTTGLFAGDKGLVQPTTLTFYIAGVECGACSELINQAVQKVPTVTNYSPYEFGIVNISFDAQAVTPQQIAQAIYEAFPAHGKPYEATLHFRVPDYAKGDNATRVDAVFARHSDQVKVEPIDKAKGEFALHFLPPKPDATKPQRPKWDWGLLDHAIRDAALEGLGLDFEIVQLGQEK